MTLSGQWRVSTKRLEPCFVDCAVLGSDTCRLKTVSFYRPISRDGLTGSRMLTIFSFFPTPVWAIQLPNDDAARINRKAMDLIETFRGQTPGIGPNDPWQTPNNLEDRPELQELMVYVKKAVSDALNDLHIVYDSFLVTGCWASIKPRGAGHGIHMHPNNFFGGVYYVRASGEGGEILFHDPRTQTSVTLPRITKENEYNTRTFRMPVRDGMLILFPAWLSHSVTKNSSETERVSISFNVQFEQLGEKMARPRW